jgi:hypothetical protein
MVGGATTIGVSQWLRTHNDGNSSRSLPDTHFAAVGRAYLPRLGETYAQAWNQGAIALDSGQPISAALDLVAKNWATDRSALFDKLLAPELTKIVPESIKDSDVTPFERAAMAAAWRGLARGLNR